MAKRSEGERKRVWKKEKREGVTDKERKNEKEKESVRKKEEKERDRDKRGRERERERERERVIKRKEVEGMADKEG